MTTFKPNDRSFKRALEIMRSAEARCGSILSDLAAAQTNAQSGLQITDNTTDNNYDRYYSELLRVMGQTLYRVCLCFLKKGEETDFYFWPGYNSILGDGQTRRIQIIPCDFSDISGGIGFDSSTSSITNDGHTFDPYNFEELIRDKDYYELSQTSVWFDCVLKSHDNDVFKDRTSFLVGGTHHWVTHGDVVLKDDGSPLEILSVGFSDKRIPIRKKGLIQINLKPTEFNDWGRAIASRLKIATTSKAQLKWPSHSLWKPDGETPRDRNTRYLTYRLYGIWLKFNFDPAWRKNDISLMIDDIRRLADDYGLINLSRRVETLANATVGRLSEAIKQDNNDIPYRRGLLERLSILKPHEYRHWYTLALKKTVTISGLKAPTELGSAMIFSSRELPKIFLSFVKPWIESIYLEIRTVEGAVLLKQTGQKQQARVFAHQTAGLLTVPWLDPGRKQLQEESQFLLWMAVTLVRQVWGNEQIILTKTIYDDPTDFPEWSNLSTEQILDKIISFALLQGLSRATRSTKEIGVPEVDEFNWKVKMLAGRLFHDPSRISLLRERLNIQIPTYKPNKWMNYKVFILCFYHSFWQAVHHGFRASIDNPEAYPSYIWIEWDDKSLTIYNRATKGNVLPTQSTDRDFLDILESKINHAFTVKGPMPLKKGDGAGVDEADSKDIWLTTITLKEAHDDN
jgi:hypothetical protein